MSASPAVSTPTFVRLGRGDPAPWFVSRALGQPRYVFDTVGGRYVLLGFLGSAGRPEARMALDAIAAHRTLFDDDKLAFFGVTIDPADEAENRIAEQVPGIRFFLDFDRAVSRLYGSLPREDEPGAAGVTIRRFWMLLDPTMRIQATFPMTSDGSELPGLFAYLDNLPPVPRFAGPELQAPILYLPNVFEPELCRRLVDLYDSEGGVRSGFMRDIGGRTVAVHDTGHKSRSDHDIQDEELKRLLGARITRRVVPEIRKVHQFVVTRMERYLVACYSAEDGGHFRAHRDNTTKATAHRRFAVSINLNDAFEGGEVSFPEYGPRSFKPPPGGAVVFSCSLLHAVSRVTSGCRYAFLPFLYDDAAAKIRDETRHLIDSGAPAGP